MTAWQHLCVETVKYTTFYITDGYTAILIKMFFLE